MSDSDIWCYAFIFGDKYIIDWIKNGIVYITRAASIWHDWKKLDRKRKNLIRLGVKKGKDYAWSRTRIGGWAVAQSPILSTTITQRRLESKGYESLVSYYQKVKI